MTKDEIMALAEQAGFGGAVHWGIADQQFIKLAQLIENATLERAAKTCEEKEIEDYARRVPKYIGGIACAVAIREMKS